jgi:hypothetical protein
VIVSTSNLQQQQQQQRVVLPNTMAAEIDSYPASSDDASICRHLISKIL